MAGQKYKVGLLLTGGTIASLYDSEEGAFKPTATLDDMITILSTKAFDIDIESKSILALDSSNIQPKHWKIIAEEAYKIYNDVDGIVIAHGTDTMAYSASAVAFMLQNLGKPVVFTGSQIPAIYPWSDAFRNLADAVRIAAKADLGEVVISFNGEIHRATRARKIRERAFDAFDSIDPAPLGFLGRNILIYGTHTKRRESKPILDTKIDESVFLLKLFPGMKPTIIEAIVNEGYKAIVIEGFGSGNVPIYENSLLPTIKKIVKDGTTVVITTQCPYGQAEPVYEVGKKIIEAGALSGYAMTSEAAVTKLMWILGHTTDPEEIKKELYTSYVGEINKESFAGFSGT